LRIPEASGAVIVGPHPDDEVLGCAGLLRHLHVRGMAIEVIAVTDGEASHPSSPTTTPAMLARRRAEESLVAYERLGLDGIRRSALHVPDGKVSANGDRLTSFLDDVLAAGMLCVAPWEGDGHPDHDTVGRLTAESTARSGATLLRYLVWTWHWAAPGDPTVPWARAARLDLTRTDRRTKRAAMAAYGSQVRPLSDLRGDAAILDRGELAHHARPFEVFLT